MQVNTALVKSLGLDVSTTTTTSAANTVTTTTISTTTVFADDVRASAAPESEGVSTGIVAAIGVPLLIVAGVSGALLVLEKRKRREVEARISGQHEQVVYPYYKGGQDVNSFSSGIQASELDTARKPDEREDQKEPPRVYEMQQPRD